MGGSPGFGCVWPHAVSVAYTPRSASFWMNPFFDGWDRVLDVVLTAPLLYVCVVVFVRISGKRSTSKMNTFDWIVTVALGSMVSTGVLSESVKLVPALAGITVLLALQWGFTKLSVYSAGFHRLINGPPSLLVLDGEFLEARMRKARVARREILAAVRESGHVSMDSVCAVVLESDGELSVIGAVDRSVYATLDDVDGVPSDVPTS